METQFAQKAAISLPATLRIKHRSESESITISLKLWDLHKLSVSHDHVFNSYTKDKGEYKVEEYSGKDSEKGINKNPILTVSCLTFPTEEKAVRDSNYSTKSTGKC